VENRYYDLTIVFDRNEGKREGIIKEIADIIAEKQGSIEVIDEWGLKKLAYPIRKKEEGFYLVLRFTSSSDAILPIREILRINEDVLRFLVTKRKKPIPKEQIEQEEEEVNEE